ncbi:MAG: STAS domain-containing protein [Chitinophagales bacterium]|nr:STAS domain-containing protein [Chitinophagales bacterium]MDW8419444.1 STAS domain-containing protein [Chitinophagales bacterium]
MSFQHHLAGNVLVITLEGNLLGEHSNTPVLELLKGNLEQGNKKVLFNLANLKFINSTGLGMLMTALTKTRNAGGEMALCNIPEQMKKILAITKLENIFPTYDDEAAALRFLQA